MESLLMLFWKAQEIVNVSEIIVRQKPYNQKKLSINFKRKRNQND